MDRSLSVIIPAHDEDAVIGHCLRSIAGQDHDGEIQVIVVANGCRDQTAGVAESWASELARRGYVLDVAELAQPSKVHSLNAGDRMAAFPDRVYLDADIELEPNAFSSIAAAFEAGVLFCAPRVIPIGESFAARAYSRVWSTLPYVRGDVIGAGLYAASEAGRARWGAFPDITADDKFARLQFAAGERHVLQDTAFYAFLPIGALELVEIRGRWIRAGWELRREFPELSRNDRRRYGGLPGYVAHNPRRWPDFLVFAAIYFAAAAQAATRSPRWERADRAREARRV